MTDGIWAAAPAPLILVVVILPDDANEWLRLDEQTGVLSISGKAYWFELTQGAKETEKKSYKLIHILQKNQLTLGGFDQIFKRFFTN